MEQVEIHEQRRGFDKTRRGEGEGEVVERARGENVRGQIERY